MSRFRYGHATHPDWRMATELALAQVEGQRGQPGFSRDGNLGLVYVTSAFAGDFARIVAALAERLPGVDWAGASAQGVCATGAEYGDEPALALMLCELPAGGWRAFSGIRRLPAPDDPAGADPSSIHTALVHADPGMPDLPGLVADLSQRVETGFLFGGITGGPDGPSPQVAGEVVSGGLSGVAFSDRVRLLTRVTQGCAPLAREHRISAASSHFIRELDGQPALDVLLEDLGVEAEARRSRDGDEILRALPVERLRSGLLVGLAPAGADRGIGFGDYTVRNVVGLDPENRLLAVSGAPRAGDRAVFCTRDAAAARADLIRICTELREELESEGAEPRGAHYVSCVARGENLFGAQGAELEIVRHNLGEIPLVGFAANGEIARDRLYGYTGVLTLFV